MSGHSKWSKIKRTKGVLDHIRKELIEHAPCECTVRSAALQG